MRQWLLASVFAFAAGPAYATPYDKIDHIIVISLENHSFDNLFGHFPGAEGLDNVGAAGVQKERDGTPLAYLPTVMDTRVHPAIVDKRFPEHMANAPFAIEKYLKATDETGDLMHHFYYQQEQIHEGKMDRFASVSDAGGLTMGYYDGSKLGLWKFAQKYTLADHFFHAAFGSSMLNHFWLVCACTPRYENAPEELVYRFDEAGVLKNGMVTDDGYVVSTLFPFANPHPKALNGSTRLMPPQEMPTIGDRLDEKHISWAWYAGGWDDANAGHPDKIFQYHHQPFVYFKGFEEGSARRAEHLLDEDDFIDALKDGTLPAVSFYKPGGEFNMHPGYANVPSGDVHVTKILRAIEASPTWKSTVVIVTFDENGGFFDHVAPPKVDRWGPGIRVPTLIISPFAKKGFVDSTTYDSTAILKFIETKYDLAPLTSRDANAASMDNAFEP